MEAAGERTRQLVEKSLVSADELEGLKAMAAARTAAIEEIRDRLAMRQRFLSGAVSAQEVEIQGRLTSAEANVKSVRAKVESLENQLERITTLERQGLADSTESRYLQAALEAAQAELKLAALEKEILEKAR